MMDDAGASPPPGLGWEDDEEPLFADDIHSDEEGDDDPPPLPPPMPSLSELAQSHAASGRTPRAMMGGGRGGGWNGTETVSPGMCIHGELRVGAGERDRGLRVWQMCHHAQVVP